jgi:pyridoxal phosphate enzyme (YggS family)
MLIQNNFYNIKQSIQNISPNIKIVVVSKNQDFSKIMELLKIGHTEFGENRFQDATFKWKNYINEYPEVNLHFIGKLQSNKVKDIFSLFNYVHSLDSEKLALQFSEVEKKNNKKIKYFIQVNIGEEPQKSGISIDECKNFVLFCKKLNLNILGLMCIPPISKDPKVYFLRLKKLNDENNFKELSMGMSDDFKVAANIGATYVRIGSAIFGKKN